MDLTSLIVRYAERFAAIGGNNGNSVGSPLGAWLVLALAAPVARGDDLAALEDALGTDVDTAHRLLLELIHDPHPAVAAAFAAWDDGFAGLRDWIAALPAVVDTGPVPSQAAVDAWAREHTFGLIEKFPVGVMGAVIVLASALATKVTWLRPFDAVLADQLRGPWESRVAHVLRTPTGRHTAQKAFVAGTSRAGRVAVHSASAGDGLEVISVIAEPHLARHHVLAAAHEIATASPERVSLFDLPLGETTIWTITEELDAARGGEDVQAVLPAWRADSRHELLSRPGLGFDVAGRALTAAADVTGGIEAFQTAVARYSRTGFEAAAITALALQVSLRMRRAGTHRTGVLNFGHPYAVVATATGRDDIWHRLPVFAAWVTEPEDADPA